MNYSNGVSGVNTLGCNWDAVIEAAARGNLALPGMACSKKGVNHLQWQALLTGEVERCLASTPFPPLTGSDPDSPALPMGGIVS